MTTNPRLSPETLSVWLAVAYAIHLCDERFVGAGIADWATRVAGLPFTNGEWLAVNSISLAIVAGIAWAIRNKTLGTGALVLLAGHILMHSTQHLLGSLRFGEVSPGVVTGLVVCLPLSLLAIRTGFQLLPRARAAAALFLGIATFQPIWHLLFHSLGRV